MVDVVTVFCSGFEISGRKRFRERGRLVTRVVSSAKITNRSPMKAQIRSFLALVRAASASMLITGAPAQAGYVVSLQQVGPNVVATGNGAIDLTGLKFLESMNVPAPLISPFSATIYTSAPPEGVADFYTGATGPKNFGTGFTTHTDSGSGDLVGIDGEFGLLLVPQNYMSGQPLSDTATYDNATFHSLDLRGGVYEYTWGSGPDQNFTVRVGVPDSGPDLSLIAVVFLLLLGVRQFQILSAFNCIIRLPSRLPLSVI